MKNIIVTGDVTADWNIARLVRGAAEGKVWNDDDFARACLQPGGAAMLGELLEKMAEQHPEQFQVSPVRLPAGLVDPLDNRSYHSYAMWKAVGRNHKDKTKVWKVESFLGLDYNCGGDSAASCKIPLQDQLIEQADIVVIDDAGLQFRSDPKFWPTAIKTGKPDWIVVKMADPIATNLPESLWIFLLTNHADRTIVLMSLNDLRKSSVRISKALSWERTALDIDWELRHNPQLCSLLDCAQVIISIGASGAYHLVNNETSHESSLLFDPKSLEGDWGMGLNGKMVGFNVCLTAALVREIALSGNTTQPFCKEGIRKGIFLMRKLWLEGYGQVFDTNKIMTSPTFPALMLAQHLKEKEDYLCWRSIPVTKPISDIESEITEQVKYNWLILQDFCTDQEKEIMHNTRVSLLYRSQANQALYNLAAELVIKGMEVVLKDVPTLCYGKLETADRTEIEAFKRIATSIDNYIYNPLSRPLCLAVFGAPGSGKSFGVKQVAKSLPGANIINLTFNITQFTDIRDLINALHQVRDIGLSGATPLVFWDEFDSNECDWLKNFLAPMQDGEFQDGQITYHIGNAIFVFAGGTSETYERFGDKLDKGNPDGKFSLKKGPDFLSRLHNYLNVLGPNPIDKDFQKDKLYIIRRGMLLRSMLLRNAPHLFKDGHLQIDPSVLRAFLLVNAYNHGARSLESIIATSSLQGKTCYDQSSLPPLPQLALHVDAQDFRTNTEGLSLRNINMNRQVLDFMAAGVHHAYCRKGDQWQNDVAKKQYDELSEDLKEENRRHVLDIVNKLERVGYTLERFENGVSSTQMAEDEVEILSEHEHMRWMKSKINLGYRYGARNDSAKLHDCLLPWTELTDDELSKLDPGVASVIGRKALSEPEKEKDRVLVRAIPEIIAMAGYRLMRD